MFDSHGLTLKHRAKMTDFNQKLLDKNHESSYRNREMNKSFH